MQLESRKWSEVDCVDDPCNVYSSCDKCEANPIKKSIISLHLFGPGLIVLVFTLLINLSLALNICKSMKTVGVGHLSVTDKSYQDHCCYLTQYPPSNTHQQYYFRQLEHCVNIRGNIL